MFSKKIGFIGSCFLFFALPLIAQQKAFVREYRKAFTTYPFSDPDPTPKIGRIYPYHRFDGYAHKPVQKEWKVVELENDYLRLMILPEIGGKVWAAIEKSTGKSFVYYNRVVKFRDVAMRGPWTSGGVEANYGIIGHTPNCATPVDYTTINKPDGSVSCVVGVLDLLTRTTWRVDVNLPKDKAYFTTSSFWYNNSPIEQPYYTWMNTGIKAKGNLEFIYPGTMFLGHSGEVGDWPINRQNGKAISFYENNDFGSYKSYHVFGKYSDFFGGYWHDEDFGMGRYSNYDDKPGKKLWIWGLSQQGMIWEKLLSDTDGQYVEVQSGRLFNQADVGSSLTPFKNRGFTPHTTDLWTEYWFPVLKTKGFVAANNYGAMNLKVENGWLKIYFSPLQNTDDELTVKQEGRVMYSKKIRFKTLRLFADSVRLNGSAGNLIATLGGDKLVYESDPAANVMSRPVQSPADFHWDNAYGLWLAGKERMRMRNFTEAEEKLKASLQKDPYFVPALTDYAVLLYRNRRFEEALTTIKKALSVDTYDPAANYYYGVISKQVGNITDARDGFSIAAAGAEYRSAAYTELAKLFLSENNLRRAGEYSQKALDFNRYGVAALEVLAVVHRLQKNRADADKVLSAVLSYDPLNHFARFEKYLWQPTTETKTAFTKLIRSEMPLETFLELAIAYHNMGRKEEAVSVLNLSPKNAEVLYWLAFLQNKPLDVPQLKADMVFPFRLETGDVMEALLKQNNHWLLKYHLGLVEWQGNNLSRAKELFTQIGDEPKHAPFYAARAELMKTDSRAYLAELQKAIKIDPNQWRYGQSLANHYLNENESQQAVATTSQYFNKFPENYVLGMLYARALMKSDRYAEANHVLQKLQVLPNEGATDGRRLYRETQLMLAAAEMKKKNYRQALEYIEAAREWPEHLGVGKPYPAQIDERLEDWMAYEAFMKMGNESAAQEMLSKIESFIPVNDRGEGYANANELIRALALQQKGKPEEAEKRLADWLKKEPDNEVAKWAMAAYNKQATKGKLPNDENIRLLKATMDLQ
jgi:tetratricopeptide (TPR) repeat protein